MANQPQKIGKYDILSLIGRGGMGVVYKARDPQLDRAVAIKMITEATPGLLKRFNIEARSMGSLQHQNIVTIYDFGDQDGNPFLVMEYLEGMSLESAISRGRPLSLVTKLNICVDVCSGLSYAHERGIIHRDIKPGNIMLLDDGGVKIVDFGIARIGNTGISRTEIVGTLHYMSPEQFQSVPLDRRTDIFSIGVVLYQLLAGVLPFPGADGAAVMYRIVHEDPAPLTSHGQDYPRELDSIISKALAKNRDLRYSSSQDLAFDLLAILEKLKHSEVFQLLNRAQTAISKTEWLKAEDCLQQVLRIHKHHTQAHQLLSHVQIRIRQQRVVEQVRQLRNQADEALLDRRYDEALGIVEQAIALDKTSEELARLRESIQEVKSRAIRFNLALRKAEEAHQAGDLEVARQSVGEALAIEPQATSAKALQVVILKQVEEQERQQRLREMLDSARDQITARNLTGAYDTLKEAERIDAGSVELFSLMKVVNAAREEQKRKAEMDKLTRQIEAALINEEYAAAIAIANNGLQGYPRDEGLLKLKALAEKEKRRIQLRAYAREQFLSASQLLEEGRTFEALTSIEKALQNAPSDIQLEMLRGMAKERLASDKAEDRKRQLLRHAQDLTASNALDDAVRVLEDARKEFAGTEEIDALLRRTRAAQKHDERVAHYLGQGQQLLTQGNFEGAVKFLENKTLEIPDARLFDLLEKARWQWQQFVTELQKAVEEGNRILRERGVSEAAEHIERQSDRYKRTPEFSALARVVASRAAWEALDQELASTPDPDVQVRLAEAAFRRNKENEEIRVRLASVRGRKEQIDAIVERTHILETSQQYADAAQELRRLRQLYPQYANLELEIQRLERLQEQRLEEIAQRQAKQFQLEMLRAIEEGGRILQRDGPAEAARYVSAQPVKFRDFQEYRAFAAQIAQLLACENLDQDLARTPDLNAQIRLAEAALRGNPVNAEIKRRLTDLRERVQQIKESHEVTTSTQVCGGFSADASHAIGEPVAGAGWQPIKPNVPSSEVPELARNMIPLRRPFAIGMLIVAFAAVAAVSFAFFYHSHHSVSATVAIKLNVTPSDSIVAVDGRSCLVPCRLGLLPGSHAVQADHEGYYRLIKQIQVEQSSSEFSLTLSPTNQPPTPVGALDEAESRHEAVSSKSSDKKNGSNRTTRPLSSMGRIKDDSDEHAPLSAGTGTVPTASIASSQPPATTALLTPPVVQFTALPESIEKGKETELHWSVQNAEQVSIDGVPVPLTDSKKVSPEKTTVYHILAQGAGGVTKDAATVIVKEVPPVKTNAGVAAAAGPDTMPSSAGSSMDVDAKAITGVLDVYRAAFESKDLIRLRHIWPTISDKQFRELNAPFKDAQQIRLTLQPAGSPQIAGDHATVSCLQSAQITHDGMVQPLKNSVNFSFRRLGDDWVIEKIEYRKAY